MAGVTVLAELVAALEREAAGLQTAAATASEADLRALVNRSASQLRGLRNAAAQGVAQDALPGGFIGAGPTTSYPVAPSGYTGSAAASVPVAKPVPEGPPQAFNRDDFTAVVKHMTLYEGAAAECAKALRALASLAYANATQVGDHPEALPQAIRCLKLHPDEDNVQLNGMRALCNMAYDPNVALNRLSTRPVLHAFISAMAGKQGSNNNASKELGSKASEGVARVVAAEVGPESGPSPAVPPERGPLKMLFTVVEYEDSPGREVVVELVKQLVNNEVATPELLAQRLIDQAESCKQSGPAAAAWLLLAKQIAMAEISTMSENLIKLDAIAAAAGVMIAQHSYGPAQLAGIEAMSGLVGSRWIGLQAFASVKGIERIETAMATHPAEAVLQTKGIRALASGIQWPEDIQGKAAYNYRHGVKLTKVAMGKHQQIEDLQIAGLEALSKYLDRAKCVEEVKEDGGVPLVKAVMARHGAVEKVKSLGKSILDALGEKE
jgi:hypothetical protein